MGEESLDNLIGDAIEYAAKRSYNVGDKEIFKECLQRIMRMLAENPMLAEHVSDSELINLWCLLNKL